MKLALVICPKFYQCHPPFFYHTVDAKLTENTLLIDLGSWDMLNLKKIGVAIGHRAFVV